MNVKVSGGCWKVLKVLRQVSVDDGDDIRSLPTVESTQMRSLYVGMSRRREKRMRRWNENLKCAENARTAAPL